jgi:hypothetical protein
VLVAVWIGHTRLTDNMPLAWDVAWGPPATKY